MGRPRKPLATQQGHQKVTYMQARAAEEEATKAGTNEIIKPPAWLVDAIAKKEWRRVVPQLLAIDVIGNLDLEAVAGYCNAFASYRKATEQLSKEPLVYESVDQLGNTVHKENPTIKVQTVAAQEMRRFADMCGLTINSRLKAAATKTKQQADDIEQQFGVI